MAELLDVVDDFGRPTGQQLSRQAAHQRGLRHRGAQVWVYNGKGEVLLQWRDPGVQIFPETWDISASGHLVAEETFEQGAIREAGEELGLKITPDDLYFLGMIRVDAVIPPTNWIHRTFDAVYLVHQDIRLEELKMQAGETVKARWCPLDEFEADVQDPETLKKYSPRAPYLFAMVIFEIRKALVA